MMSFYIQITNLPKLWLNVDLIEERGKCFKNNDINIVHAIVTHQSAAACGQTFSPSQPSRSPPDLLPKASSQSAMLQDPAS